MSLSQPPMARYQQVLGGPRQAVMSHQPVDTAAAKRHALAAHSRLIHLLGQVLVQARLKHHLQPHSAPQQAVPSLRISPMPHGPHRALRVRVAPLALLAAIL